MNAKDVADTFGKSLVGMECITQAIGLWPGGPCRVLEIYPDPSAAPEIVMCVEHLDEALRQEHGRCGVFDYEDIHFPKLTTTANE